MLGECVISSVLFHHNKNSKRQTSVTSDRCYSSQTALRYSSWTDQCHSSMLQLSFIWKIKENTSLRHEGMLTQKTWREERVRARERGKGKERERKCEGEGGRDREREGPLDFWLLFLYVFFFSPWACPMKLD